MLQSRCVAELSPLDVAACYADYHVYSAVNDKLASLPPEKDKKKKKPAAKNVVVKPRHGADIYHRRLARASKLPPAASATPGSRAASASRASAQSLQVPTSHHSPLFDKLP